MRIIFILIYLFVTTKSVYCQSDTLYHLDIDTIYMHACIIDVVGVKINKKNTLVTDASYTRFSFPINPHQDIKISKNSFGYLYNNKNVFYCNDSLEYYLLSRLLSIDLKPDTCIDLRHDNILKSFRQSNKKYYIWIFSGYFVSLNIHVNDLRKISSRDYRQIDSDYVKVYYYIGDVKFEDYSSNRSVIIRR